MPNDTILQNIHDRMTLKIDHDRPIARGMPPTPIINAHNPNNVFLYGRRSTALQLPQDRVVADRHAEPMHQVLSWTTAHPVANQADNLRHPPGSSHIGCSNLGQSVGEGSSPAFPLPTLPSVQCEFDSHHLTLNRQVLEAAVVPAVPVPALRSAIRADTDRFRSIRNNPVFFILNGDTQYSDLWAG
jgi:hypothetical protein